MNFSSFNLGDLQTLYLQFLNNFPAQLRPVISIGLAVLLIYALIKVIKKDWLYLIVLIVLLPGSIPILKSVWAGIVSFVKFLLSIK